MSRYIEFNKHLIIGLAIGVVAGPVLLHARNRFVAWCKQHTETETMALEYIEMLNNDNVEELDPEYMAQDLDSVDHEEEIVQTTYNLYNTRGVVAAVKWAVASRVTGHDGVVGIRKRAHARRIRMKTLTAQVVQEVVVKANFTEDCVANRRVAHDLLVETYRRLNPRIRTSDLYHYLPIAKEMCFLMNHADLLAKRLSTSSPWSEYRLPRRKAC